MKFLHLRKWKKRIGQRGENAACALLEDEGCSVLARNCRLSSGGELDIVARDGDTLVFTEVKTRFHKPGLAAEDIMPERNLKPSQKRRIVRGAFAYLRALEYPQLNVRFDLIEVLFNRLGVELIQHHPNAFDASVLRKHTENFY